MREREREREMCVVTEYSQLYFAVYNSCVLYDTYTFMNVFFMMYTQLIHTGNFIFFCEYIVGIYSGFSTCDMTRSYVCRDSFTCWTWLIHMCDMASSLRQVMTLRLMQLWREWGSWIPLEIRFFVYECVWISTCVAVCCSVLHCVAVWMGFVETPRNWGFVCECVDV